MGKKWRNPPVFYTLTQTKFNPITQLEEYIPKLQDKLRRSGYPDFKPGKKIEITVNKSDGTEPDIRSQPVSGWSFANAERTEGYILHSDALIYHSTKYEDFKDFLQKAQKGLELVHEAVNLAYVERIGLRYLDVIVPQEDDSLEDYINPSLLGMSANIQDGLTHSFSETAAQINGGTLIARAVVTEGGLAMPPDLFPMQLAMPARLNSIVGRTVVMDTDYFVKGRSDFDLGSVETQLTESHKIIGEVFKKAITKHAIKVWE